MGVKLEIGDLKKITTYQAGVIQAAAHRALRLHCDNILSPYGITKTEWMVIGMALDADSEGILLAEICRQLDLEPNSLARVVSVLEKRRMVVRTTSGKQKAIAIHPTFARDCPEIERILRTALRASIYSSVTPLEFRIYLKVLYQLSRLSTDIT